MALRTGSTVWAGARARLCACAVGVGATALPATAATEEEPSFSWRHHGDFFLSLRLGAAYHRRLGEDLSGSTLSLMAGLPLGYTIIRSTQESGIGVFFGVWPEFGGLRRSRGTAGQYSAGGVGPVVGFLGGAWLRYAPRFLDGTEKGVHTQVFAHNVSLSWHGAVGVEVSDARLRGAQHHHERGVQLFVDPFMALSLVNLLLPHRQMTGRPLEVSERLVTAPLERGAGWA